MGGRRSGSGNAWKRDAGRRAGGGRRAVTRNNTRACSDFDSDSNHCNIFNFRFETLQVIAVLKGEFALFEQRTCQCRRSCCCLCLQLAKIKYSWVLLYMVLLMIFLLWLLCIVEWTLR